MHVSGSNYPHGLFRYLSTWSAVRAYRNKLGIGPMDRLRRELRGAWGNAQPARTVTWPLFVRVGRIGGEEHNPQADPPSDCVNV